MKYSVFISFLVVVSPITANQQVDFSRQILPILSNKCFQCHGPDRQARKARLRLDDEEVAKSKLRRGRIAIVPGNPEESHLIKRIFTTDQDDLMPPRELGKPLTEHEKQLLKIWIAQGAKYEKHWAFVAPKRPPLPNVNTGSNPIDSFILHRLQQDRLSLSKIADKQTLIRRVTLDLTGLPPTPDEVNTFVSDHSENTYEKLVERLLASPAYGERWGRVWLDLARYADSAGYADDPPRTIWMYRDYVIDAINRNIPFDQFTIEQLAGDLLPDPTNRQLLATAFHRNTMTNNEGGTSDEEFRNAAIVDRVNTTYKVWMGLTMECAQCHDHKYDPITQKEYFESFAIFNNTEDSDKKDERPTISQLTSELQQRREQIQQQITKLEQSLAQRRNDAKGTTEVPKGPLRTRYLRIEHLGKNVFLSLAEVQAFVDKKNVATQGKASQSSVDYNGPAKLAIDGNTNGDYVQAKSTTHTKQENNPWWEVDLSKDSVVNRIVVWNRTDGNTGTRLNMFRIIAMNAKRQPLWAKTVRQVPTPSIEVTLPTTAEALTNSDLAEIAQLGSVGGKLSKEQQQIAALKKQLALIKGVPTPIMRELPVGKRRLTHIQIRGSFQDKGEQVSTGLPSEFPKPDTKDKPIDRLTLARWLVSRNNPLTARVLVNRYWELLFGRGLVETSEDFGRQGMAPSHPKLLDWLAVELMDQGWDTKKLIWLIVTSDTYRQSSTVSQELLKRDPNNELLARGPRFRLSAEMIRDQALAVSGLLSRKMNGPSVNPPRPKLGLRAAFGGSTDWQTSKGDDRYRRGLYTSWRRSDPYPSMACFDAPTREVATVRRIRTNTPLQALVTLNDPVYIEAAQALARRILQKEGASIDDKVDYAYRLCLSRSPSKQELSRITLLYQRAKQRFQQQPIQARQLATEPLGTLPPDVDAIEAATWTLISNVLMNLDEFLARR